MSKASFKILNLPDFINQVKDRFDTDIILDRLQRALELSREDISRLIIEKVFSSPTWRSLFDDRVQYELGFLPEELDDVQFEIESLLRDSIETNSFVRREGGRFASQTNDAATVFLNISFTRLEDQILSIDASTFASKRGFEIPWLKWVLDGGAVDGYHVILASVTGKDFELFSRTGGAIMGLGGSWSTNRLGLGDDFIAQVLNDESIQKEIANIVERNL